MKKVLYLSLIHIYPKTASKVHALTDKIIKENSLTAMMVTHNMRDAIAHGNRLIMMNNGQVVLKDVYKRQHVFRLQAMIPEAVS